MKFLNAFIWTFLLILLTGVFLLGSELVLASIVHAPKFLEFGVEGVSILGLLWLFAIVFKQAFEAEKNDFEVI